MYDQASASAISLADIQYAMMQEFRKPTDRDGESSRSRAIGGKYSQSRVQSIRTGCTTDDPH